MAELSVLVNLRDKLPEAIGWRLLGPYRISFPEEIREALHGRLPDTVISAALHVYNSSDVSKSEIRVLYSGGFKFKPRCSYDRRDVPVKWVHDEANKEFIFHDTPPKEIIEIELFDLRQGFSIDQVLVDGKLVTEFMSKRALALAYPASKWLSALLVSLFVFSIAGLAIIGYSVYQQSQNSDLLHEVPYGYMGCDIEVVDNPPGDDHKAALARKLNKQMDWWPILMAKNKVSSVDELYNLDRIVLCTTETLKKQAGK